MKRKLFLLMLAVALALVSITLARAGPGVAVAPAGTAILSGGRYRLVGASASVDVVASGGGYRLLGPASPSGGNQCCCTYLPCVLRNH